MEEELRRIGIRCPRFSASAFGVLALALDHTRARRSVTRVGVGPSLSLAATGRSGFSLDRRSSARRPTPSRAAMRSSGSAHPGSLLYGSDMEGGGPYAYPDPEFTARRDRLRSRTDGPCWRRAGRRRRVLAGPVGQAAPGPRRRPDRRRDATATNGPRRGPATTWRRGPITSISCS